MIWLQTHFKMRERTVDLLLHKIKLSPFFVAPLKHNLILSCINKEDNKKQTTFFFPLENMNTRLCNLLLGMIRYMQDFK